MYSRKSVRLWMDPWETPTLTGYSCEDFPCRVTRSCLLRRKEKIRPNIWPEIPQGLGLWRRPACQTLSKALGISHAIVWVASDLLKVLAILSDATFRRSAVDLEDLNHTENQKKTPHFFRWSTTLLFTIFWKTLLTTERRPTGQYLLGVDLSPIFLNTGTTKDTF